MKSLFDAVAVLGANYIHCSVDRDDPEEPATASIRMLSHSYMLGDGTMMPAQDVVTTFVAHDPKEIKGLDALIMNLIQVREIVSRTSRVIGNTRSIKVGPYALQVQISGHDEEGSVVQHHNKPNG